MNKKHHRIAADVKADILRRVKEEGISVAQAAKEHGISEGTIYGWMVKGATGAPSWAEFSRLQKQNRELRHLWWIKNTGAAHKQDVEKATPREFRPPRSGSISELQAQG